MTGELQSDNWGSNETNGNDGASKACCVWVLRALSPGLLCSSGCSYPVYISIKAGSSSLFLGGGGESSEGEAGFDLLAEPWPGGHFLGRCLRSGLEGALAANLLSSLVVKGGVAAVFLA